MKSYNTRPLNLNQSATGLLNDVREALDELFRKNNIGYSAAICVEPMPELKMDEPPPTSVTYLTIYVEDDDLNEPLGTPSCDLGEACESCQ
jgi:hypothetical protein